MLSLESLTKPIPRNIRESKVSSILSYAIANNYL
jgi:hypothetical protein